MVLGPTGLEQTTAGMRRGASAAAASPPSILCILSIPVPRVRIRAHPRPSASHSCGCSPLVSRGSAVRQAYPADSVHPHSKAFCKNEPRSSQDSHSQHVTDLARVWVSPETTSFRVRVGASRPLCGGRAEACPPLEGISERRGPLGSPRFLVAPGGCGAPRNDVGSRVPAPGRRHDATAKRTHFVTTPPLH